MAEYDSAGALKARYVHGAGVDDPLVWYEGAGTADRRYLMSDERGSIVALTRQDGSLLQYNRYDEWGIPDPENSGRLYITR